MERRALASLIRADCRRARRLLDAGCLRKAAALLDLNTIRIELLLRR